MTALQTYEPSRKLHQTSSNHHQSLGSVIKSHARTMQQVHVATSAQDDSLDLHCLAQVWSVPGQRFQFTFSGHSNWVRSCCFSPDGRLAVSGSDDKTVRIWDVATRQCIRVYDDHSGYVNTVAFHPDGTCVASAGTDNAIKVRSCAHFGL